MPTLIVIQTPHPRVSAAPVPSPNDCMCAVVRPRASYRNCSVNKAVSCCAVSEALMRPVVSRLLVWLKGVGAEIEGGGQFALLAPNPFMLAKQVPDCVRKRAGAKHLSD